MREPLGPRPATNAPKTPIMKISALGTDLATIPIVRLRQRSDTMNKTAIALGIVALVVVVKILSALVTVVNQAGL